MKNSPTPNFMSILGGYRATQAICVAAQLSIPDLVKEGCLSLTEIASATKTNPPFLSRFLKVLCTLEILTENETDYFSLGRNGKFLLSDEPRTLKHYALMIGQSWYWNPWSNLLNTLETGRSGFEEQFGVGFFDYLESDKNSGAIFDRAMTGTTEIAADVMSKVITSADIKSVVDVGGGIGVFIQKLLVTNAGLTGVLQDLPGVITRAREFGNAKSLAGRLDFNEQSFFHSIVANADAYIMRHILHDWGDQECLAILKNCRVAMKTNSKLFILERIQQPDSHDILSSLMDLEMMVLMRGGRERTEQDFSSLLKKVDLALDSTTWSEEAQRFILQCSIG